MSKKRNRQPDVNGDASEASTESCEELNAAEKCPHISKAVNLNKVKKNLKKAAIGTECSACTKVELNSPKTNEEEEEGVDVMSPALWICLRCGNQSCGRAQRQHAIEHYQKPHSDCHCMVTDTHQWSVWCYQCEAQVSPDTRKMLLETVEFLKKSATASQNTSQPKIPVIPCQKPLTDVDKEKQKILNNLPTVRGLANLGNTCFFNAVLQCLAQTPFLVKVLDDLRAPGQRFILPGGKHKTNENVVEPPIEGTLEGWGNFTSILYKTLTELQSTNGRQTYRPTELLSAFKKRNMQCMDGGQHDSHELLRHLLELVRSDDLRRYQSVILKEVGLNEKTKPDCVEDSLKSRVKYYGNQANARLLGPDLVFRGVLVSTLECLDCHHSSQRTEQFLDLSLPVMADKPQPPVLKRKNSGFEDAFDMMGNISNAPSKHQLKKEKKAARKNRKNKRHENHINNDILSNQNNQTIEETNGSVLESEESDADVEDNIEVEGGTLEVGESGYSSEKASAVASPVSPTDHHISNQDIDLPNVNGAPLEGNLLLNPLDNANSVQPRDTINSNSLNSPSPTDMSMTDLTQMRLSSEVDRLESSETPENENGERTLSTSLVNSDLTTPDAPTVSSFSSSMISKDSPISPLSTTMNGDSIEKIERPVSRLDHTESMSKEKKDYSDCPLDLTKDHGKSLNSHTSQELSDEQKSNNEWNCNGIGDIMSGISKLGLANCTSQSSIRYPTKEGECSIQSCLNQFTALELMSGSNKVGCEACTAKERKAKQSTKMVCTPSTKQYLISRVPAVLILHLKRFQAQRCGFRKVVKHVTFPMLLDLAPVCKDHTRPRLYALYGVVEHSGTLHGGHYVAYVKTRAPLTPDDPRWSFLPNKDAKDTDGDSSSMNSDSEEEASAKASAVVEPPPGRWYYVSDSRVTEVDESTVLKSQAYGNSDKESNSSAADLVRSAFF